MSMYDLAVADGHQYERGSVLLAVLGRPAVARFRDAWAEKVAGGLVIHLYTRTGGGNRACTCKGDQSSHVPDQCWAACNEALKAHPLYLRDADDEFDPTYAGFWFSSPDVPEVREALEGIAVDPVDTDARWREAIERVKRGELTAREVAAVDQIGAALGDTSPGAHRVIRI